MSHFIGRGKNGDIDVMLQNLALLENKLKAEIVALNDGELKTVCSEVVTLSGVMREILYWIQGNVG